MWAVIHYRGTACPLVTSVRFRSATSFCTCLKWDDTQLMKSPTDFIDCVSSSLVTAVCVVQSGCQSCFLLFRSACSLLISSLTSCWTWRHFCTRPETFFFFSDRPAATNACQTTTTNTLLLHCQYNYNDDTLLLHFCTGQETFFFFNDRPMATNACRTTTTITTTPLLLLLHWGIKTHQNLSIVT